MFIFSLHVSEFVDRKKNRNTFLPNGIFFLIGVHISQLNVTRLDNIIKHWLTTCPTCCFVIYGRCNYYCCRVFLQKPLPLYRQVVFAEQTSNLRIMKEATFLMPHENVHRICFSIGGHPLGVVALKYCKLQVARSPRTTNI
jgi:hypothetical protein